MAFNRKEEANIAIINLKNGEDPFLNVKDNKQVLFFAHYLFGIDPNQLMPMSAFLLERNILTRTTTRTPLEVVPCGAITTDMTGLNMNFLPADLLEIAECVEFTKDTLIGLDK